MWIDYDATPCEEKLGIKFILNHFHNSDMRLPTGQPNIFDRAWRWVFKFDVKAVRFLQSRR